MKTVAVLVAGGSGRRMGGDSPKQFLHLAGRSILDRTLASLLASPRVDGVVLVLPPGAAEGLRAPYLATPRVIAVVEGGAERRDSVRRGLASVPHDAEIILVHDAVRPFVSPDLVGRCIDGAAAHGAVVPVIPVLDTVKAWEGGKGTLVTRDRSALLRAQTPQGFSASVIREAYARAAAEGRLGTDDASLVEAIGHPVVAVPGDEENIKITVPAEFRMAAGLLREEDDYRIGLGGDAHRLVPGRDLWLGGIRLEHDRGLLGHSDGDVLLHAVADAIYGALGDHDIGWHFPPGREETRGIASREIVAHARGRMIGRGYGLLGLDSVIVCEEPKIAPVAGAIRDSVAGMLGVPAERVGVKGKTTEGMGFEGRREGISAWAVALLRGAAPNSDRRG